MVASSLLFLVACICQTQYLRADAWKGDALALLLASTDEDISNSADRSKVESEKVRVETLKWWLDCLG
jgi:hypothetical protein